VGTSEDKLLIEALRQQMQEMKLLSNIDRKAKILVTAPTNDQVFKIAEHLQQAGLNMVFSTSCEAMKRLRQEQREETLSLAHKVYQHALMNGEEKLVAYVKNQELGASKETKRMYRKYCQIVLDYAEIICATPSACNADFLKKMGYFYPVIIFCEAARIEETSIIQPISDRTEKLLFIGDHKRAYPFVQEELSLNKQELLKFSTFERLLADPRFIKRITMLKHQDSIPNPISAWMSNICYEGQLVSMSRKEGKYPNGERHRQLYFEDVCGREYWWDDSLTNDDEAYAVFQIVEFLQSQNVPEKDITVLTGFRSQVKLLSDGLPKSVRCTSIDGYADGNNKYIVASLVYGRNRKSCDLDPRQLATLFSAPREGLYLVGCSQILKKSKLSALIRNCEGRPRYSQKI
jgi:superfamily I DNA and/or RNA helicase